ncbi:MAG: hypothetical protein U0841_30850 [Chloroflexia bacterium]
MRQRYVWPFAAFVTLMLAACTFGPAPTPAPPTPTPRARSEQIARATEVAAQITATAVARAQPTNTPTPRPTVAPRATLAAKPGSGKSTKATPIEWHAVPLEDGQRYRDATGLFALTIPQEWEAYPMEEGSILAMFIAPEDGNELQTNVNVIVLELPREYWVLPLSDVTNEAVAQIRGLLKENYTVERIERIETNGMQIDRLVGIDTVDDAYIMQTYLIVGHTLHVVTFFSPTDRFEEDLPIFDSILASYSTTGR